MSMTCARARSVAVLIACVIAVEVVVSLNMAHAQQPSVRPYESEEDLWEALREGEITQDEYDDLIETIRLGIDSAFVPRSDLESLPGSDAGYLSPPDSADDIAQPENLRSTTVRGLRLRWRSGFDGRLSSPTNNRGYATGHLEGDYWKALIDWRQDNRGGRWQRRVFELRTRGVSMQVGNVEPRWGRGLVIGRRSRVIGTSTDEALDGDVIQPALSRYNGVWLFTDKTRSLSVDALASDIRSDSLAEQMIGAQIVGARGNVRGGVAALAGSITREGAKDKYTQNVVGSYLQVGADDRIALAEIARERHGATAKAAEMLWRFERGRFHGKAWSYSERFINPWGGGPSHSDQTSVQLDAIDESYSSRTTGERGFALNTELNARPVLGGKASARWDWMTHRETPSEPLAHTWTASVTWNRRDVRCRPYARGESKEGEQERFALGFYNDIGPTTRRISLRFEAGRHRVAEDRYVRTGAGTNWQLNEHVLLKPKFLWVDPNLDEPGDGYWYFYFTERITPSKEWSIEAALVWQRYEDRGEGDLVELRVRGVVGI